MPIRQNQGHSAIISVCKPGRHTSVFANDRGRVCGARWGRNSSRPAARRLYSENPLPETGAVFSLSPPLPLPLSPSLPLLAFPLLIVLPSCLGCTRVAQCTDSASPASSRAGRASARQRQPPLRVGVLCAAQLDRASPACLFTLTKD